MCPTLNFIQLLYVVFQRREGGFFAEASTRWVGVFENLQDMVGSFWGEKTLNEGA